MTTSPVMGITEEILGEIERAGWKLVPVEPTPEMITAGKEAHWEADDAATRDNAGFEQFGMRVKRAAHVYRAMLAAAPEYTAQEGQSHE